MKDKREPKRIELDQVVPVEQWEVYRRVIEEVRASKIPFALGGALALGVYTGKFRNTKDLDLYVVKRDREAMIAAVHRAGLTDYYETLPYDREWIYRAHDDGIIVDTIWAMANHHAEVDDRWISAGPQIELGGEILRVLPPEELMWSKLYVLQRDRCDWPDVLNLMHAAGPSLNWDHLVRRLGADQPLLKGVLSIFGWICPTQAHALPGQIWKTVDLPRPESTEQEGQHSRASLLDTRPWFPPVMAEAVAG